MSDNQDGRRSASAQPDQHLVTVVIADALAARGWGAAATFVRDVFGRASASAPSDVESRLRTEVESLKVQLDITKQIATEKADALAAARATSNASSGEAAEAFEVIRNIRGMLDRSMFRTRDRIVEELMFILDETDIGAIGGRREPRTGSAQAEGPPRVAHDIDAVECTVNEIVAWVRKCAANNACDDSPNAQRDARAFTFIADQLEARAWSAPCASDHQTSGGNGATGLEPEALPSSTTTPARGPEEAGTSKNPFSHAGYTKEFTRLVEDLKAVMPKASVVCDCPHPEKFHALTCGHAYPSTPSSCATQEKKR